MTISSTTSRWDYSGDGSTDTFAYDNKIFTTSELKVYVDGVLQTLTTDYTVSGAGNEAGGNVVFVSAPADGTAIAILRLVGNTQPADLPASGPFPTSSVEDSLDRRAIVSQQEAEKINRALKFLESDTGLPTASLPALANLKGKVLSFNASTGAPEALAIADISVAIDVNLTSEADNDFLVFDGTNWVNETPTEVRATLGLEAALEDVASATTTDIGAASSQNVRITGTTTITGLGTADAGTYRRVRFAAALTLTHNGTSLILPGTANITTAADDTATFISLGSGNWLCLSYKRATALPVAFVDEDDMSSDSAVLVPSQQSVKAYVDRTCSAGGSLDLSSGTGGTISNLGGVTDPDFIELDLADISSDSTDNVEITIGDSGGLETSGYDAGSAPAGLGVGGVIASTSAFILRIDGAAKVLHIRVVMTHLGGNKWLFVATGGTTTSGTGGVLAWGTKTLSGTLTQVAIGLSGAASFDGTGGGAELRAGNWA